MTIKAFKEIIKRHNISDDTELIMNDNDGGELNYEFPIDGVFYNQKNKEIAFVSEILYAHDYLGEDDWICLNVSENEKEEFFIENFIEKARKATEFKIEDYKEYLDFLDKNKRMVNPQNLGLKLLVFTDLKETFEIYEEQILKLINDSEDFDLCILIGDIYDWHLKQLLKVIPKEKIIAIPGKHSPYINVYEENGICDVSSFVFHKKGVKIHGISSYEHKLCESQSYCLKFARMSPYKNVDILITCDAAFMKDKDNTKNPGLIGITDYIYLNNIKYHIHRGNETYQSQYNNGTKEISVDKFTYVEI